MNFNPAKVPSNDQGLMITLVYDNEINMINRLQR